MKKGSQISSETRKKMCKAQKGNKNPNFGKHFSKEVKQKISDSEKGKHISNDHKIKISESNKRRIYSKETRKKLSEGQRGEKGSNWKGGITPLAKLIRHSAKYVQWRQDCFIRDNFSCKKCGQEGRNLNVHHKKPFFKLIQEASYYIPLFPLYDACMLYAPLWNLANGITLCTECHKKISR